MQNTVSVEKLRLQDPYIKISGFSEEVGVSVSFFFILFFSSRRVLNVYGGIADTTSKSFQEQTGKEKNKRERKMIPKNNRRTGIKMVKWNARVYERNMRERNRGRERDYYFVQGICVEFPFSFDFFFLLLCTVVVNAILGTEDLWQYFPDWFHANYRSDQSLSNLTLSSRERKRCLLARTN